MSTSIPSTEISREARVRLVGQSRNGAYKGSVFTATRILKSHGVSINAVETTTFDGSPAGQPMFSARVDVILPGHVDAMVLSQALERIRNDIAVDIELCAGVAA